MREFCGQWIGEGLRDTNRAGGDGEGGSLGLNGPLTREADGERMARLVRTIEGEIVPRLVLARRVSGTAGETKQRVIKSPDAADVKELVRLLLTHEADVASGFVGTVRHRGASLEMVCLELLAPAARELGLMWEADECDFMQVTVGLCRLHQVLREISVEFRPQETQSKADRCVLLAPVPGEQHTFGIMLVAQFMRRAGWDVWNEFPETLADILAVVRQKWFAVMGLSVGCDSRVDDVAAIIRIVRCASRNRAMGVLVGGPLLVAHPELVLQVGADATAVDGRQAVTAAEQMCGQQAALN